MRQRKICQQQNRVLRQRRGKKKEKNKESNNAAAYSNEGKIQDIKAQSLESARNFCAGSFEGCPSRPSSPPLTVDRYRGAGHVSLR